MHWAFPYIGLKHTPGGRSHYEVDCWGLVRLIYEKEFNITLPLHPGITSASVLGMAHCIQDCIKDEWIEVETPFDGCGVGMSFRSVIHHVGIYVAADGGKVLHCPDKYQSIVETIPMLQMRGFRVIKFYRHFLWSTSSIPSTPTRFLTAANVGR